ncbi:low molecular weight phosphotyrosine protein phosphatase [Pseudooceanicola sediminis]|uniref:protein-tyrosine-phosphatase n=1 Tax=Pseudooceanicola sediminis TaxID=2211117 RepID=A0A399J3E6_9RHOB|nr:low molecular weight protein-tyrosine-phosphatase [Pseudooceanicola sediminis]KAA2312349.1 low molecular weight phosphotyrosine protein phosphatase [Puniceibacterium sp. HSS470]RII37476.1 low molecular weight phosphotyrosine protein phosphatase [Pseudooceanicola sediminis]|tara:strand:- start:1721 stop:2188 length:468 start_codon:yes stop_codon:yes gene_type:complete
MTTSILFVCLGNICRSPSAEAVARQMAPGLRLDSAGTGGWHAGEPPYEAMQAAARTRGYDLSDLRARQFRRADFDDFDLILAMDPANLRDIEAQRPAGHATPVRLFTCYLPQDSRFMGADAVPDPWYTRDFDGALDLIEACTRGLLAELGETPRS